MDALLRTVTKVTAALRGRGIPFALTGGCAVFARGGPTSEHDVDVLVREQDVTHALHALVVVGMRAAKPPEDWLLKAYDGDRLVDLVFRSAGQPVTDEMLAGAEELRVGSMMVPVMPATFLVVDKLLVLDSHHCDFAELLPVVRLLREQVDWPRVRERTADSPYAQAFLFLAERLGIMPPNQDVAA
ncbi:nucleotidyltransferase family protein [Streptoalloteichus tenebrarius]|nr:nucleotidyltransferase family protein [Streptoalloteichus tenebrarius]